MAKLTVFQNGEKIHELSLKRGQEYTIGRGSLCDIILSHPEISRQHLKVGHDGTNWSCHVSSKFGKITVNGHPVSEFTLVDGVHFLLPPFEFRFEEAAEGLQDLSTDEDFSEKTNVAPIPLVPVLYRIRKKGQPVEEFLITEDIKLEAGRSKTCQIQLTDPKASRKHFSISVKNSVVTLKDNGSSNKTYVNNQEVSTVELQSGDDIRVGEDRFRFELVNPEFKAPLGGNTSEDTQPAVVKIDLQNLPAEIQFGGTLATNTSSPLGKTKRKKPQNDPKKFYIVAGIFIAALVGVLMMSEDPAPPQKSPNQQNLSSTAPGTAPLSPQQVKFLDDTLKLAEHLYRNQKPELALQKLSEIFRMVPDYKNARTLEGLAQQLFEVQQQQLEEQRLARQQAETQEQVRIILDECQALIRGKRFTEVEGCVGRIAEIDPENARGQELIMEANAAIEQAEMSMEARLDAARRKKQAKALFESARSDFSRSEFKSAKRKFASIGRISFYDNEGLKSRAKQGFEEATRRLNEQVSQLVREGQGALETREFKKALTTFNKILNLDPGNGDAKILKDKTLKELNLAMKNLYQESIVEESTGAIDKAKQKWQLILDTSPKSNDYHKKAKVKLGKYER